MRKESEILCHPAFDDSEYDSLAVSQNKYVMANTPMDIEDGELETKEERDNTNKEKKNIQIKPKEAAK